MLRKTRGEATGGGFTLLEVVVVIGVIALLAIATLPLAYTQLNRAKIRATQAELQELKSSLLRYYQDVYNQEVGTASQRGHLFPLSTGDATADVAALERRDAVLPTVPEVQARWRGPYLESPAGAARYALDAWDRPYRYDYTPAQTSCALTSGGPDRNLATDADNITIVVNGIPAVLERMQRVKADLAVIQRAAQRYAEDHGTYPTDINALIPTYLQPAYRYDPWGVEYVVTN